MLVFKNFREPVWNDEARTRVTAIVDISDDDQVIAADERYTFDAREHAEIIDALTAGEHGPVAEYEPPELRPVFFPPLSARQFRLGLLAHGLLTQVDEAVAALEEPQRSAAEIEWEYATSFDRTHPLVAALSAHIGLTDEQIDEMWLEAKEL